MYISSISVCDTPRNFITENLAKLRSHRKVCLSLVFYLTCLMLHKSLNYASYFAYLS